MKHNIYSIQNFCNTLLSDWVEWNSGLLKGNFSTDASNVTQALGVDNSTGRSRAKEMYRIGLLTMELTKGNEALSKIHNGENIQSRLGYLAGLIFKGYEIEQTEAIRKGYIALCSIFSVIQSFEIGSVQVSVNTVFQRLLNAYPCPSDYDIYKWMKYLIAGFSCELSYSDDQERVIQFLKGETKTLTLRIVENDQVSKKKNTEESKRTRAVIKDIDSLREVIDNKVSLTDIFHQKTPLFSIGSLKSGEPEGYYGLAFKYFPEFLNECFLLEISNIDNSPFGALYKENEGDECQKPYVIESLKQISSSNPNFETIYQVIMNTIEKGAVEALSFMMDKPESSYFTAYVPSDEDEKHYNTFLTALRTKPFLLLAGISGTGKSQKVQELAFMTCPKNDETHNLRDPKSTTPGNYQLVEVKPNWHDSTELLGYYSALSGKYELTDFIRFTYKALQNTDVPFFLCLDEMNLAPVEQYFAEFLSVLETRKKTDEGIKTQPLLTKDKFSNCELMKKVLVKEDGDILEDGKQYKMEFLYSEKDSEIIEYLKTNGLHLPDNLFVIGTVNMDDTTHQFSRKVIDRAFTIEMNGGKMSEMFTAASKTLLEYREEPLPLAAFQSRFVRAYEVLDDAQFSKYAEKISKEIPALLGDSDGTAAEDSINGILNNTPFRVSYRVQNELVLYLSVLIENAGFPDEIDALIGEATLAILLEKVLPRVQGEQKQLETKGGKSNILKDMKAFVETHFAPTPDENGETKENPLYTKVVKKLEEMDGKLTGYYTNFF